MDFCKKLQDLRKQKGLTQEELATQLFVSRTAISKWESGRGYPSIDSLKSISELFSVSVDELLSGDELITVAKEDNKIKLRHLCDLVFGLLDISVLMIFFLPFLGQKLDGVIHSVSLLSLTESSLYLRIIYFVLITGMFIFGVLTLAMQTYNQKLWIKIKAKISLVLNAVATLIFVISSQPYAAAFLFLSLTIKTLIHIKSR